MLAEGHASMTSDGKFCRGCALVCSALCMLGLLAALRSLHASVQLLVVAALFFAAVAVGRSTLWSGTKPALAAVLTAGLIGVLVTGYLLPGARVQLHVARAYSHQYATQLVLEMILVTPVCMLLGCLIHTVLSACCCLGEIAAQLYSAWRNGQRTDPALRASLLRRLALYTMAALVIFAVYSPLEKEVYRRVGRNFFIRAVNGGPPPFPVEAWLIRLQYGARAQPYAEPETCFLWVYEACRDRLVASGALVHRRFVFRHVKDGTDDASVVWQAAMARFPGNIHTTWTHDPGAPMVLEVWATPEEIPRWERFVREHDVADSSKK